MAGKDLPVFLKIDGCPLLSHPESCLIRMTKDRIVFGGLFSPPSMELSRIFKNHNMFETILMQSKCQYIVVDTIPPKSQRLANPLSQELDRRNYLFEFPRTLFGRLAESA
jgi:hypothetical protein